MLQQWQLGVYISRLYTLSFSSSTPSSVPFDMQVDPVNTSAQVPLPTEDADKKPYTILRIKRKRNEEPLDALGK